MEHKIDLPVFSHEEKEFINDVRNDLPLTELIIKYDMYSNGENWTLPEMKNYVETVRYILSLEDEWYLPCKSVFKQATQWGIVGL